MCIRDSINAEYGDFPSAAMVMRSLLLVSMALVVANVLSAEVAVLDAEEANIVYRISYTCQPGESEDKTSQGTYTINIKGTNKEETGEQTLVVNPGYKCIAKGNSHLCYTNEHGVVPTEASRGGFDCPCDPTLHEKAEYDDKKWQRDDGQHKQVYLFAKDVGEVSDVVIKSTSSNKEAGEWKLVGLKINTVSQQTGLGNGIFYVSGQTITPGSPLEASLSATTTAGDEPGTVPTGATCSKNDDCASARCDMNGDFSCELKCVKGDATKEKTATQNCPEEIKGKITRCDAQVCEERMEKMMRN
eukprot:TRINITY_DN4480_c0_g1_i1.p1 TRINITY_DN4480_c0_g1~~TRINITY_DN4480_c0_g1_i1.p1  ORF type:complete len:302 (+),score=93.44 TRINITY_DN4480_c0_g1_i1:114-1019(+)